MSPIRLEQVDKVHPTVLAVDHPDLHFFDPETGLAVDGAGRSTVAV